MADAEASAEDDADDEPDKSAKDAKAEQPVWRERLERRVSGGKRKKRR
jgi:hypothetical protein